MTGQETEPTLGNAMPSQQQISPSKIEITFFVSQVSFSSVFRNESIKEKISDEESNSS